MEQGGKGTEKNTSRFFLAPQVSNGSIHQPQFNNTVTNNSFSFPFKETL